MSESKQLTVGGGCFWCTEAIFQRIKGVEKVVSGYSGGDAPGVPTYREVCSGLTGHAEAIQVTYDPEQITYEDLLKIFLTSHDPTTENRQGADVGTQYRSVIFYQNEDEKIRAQKVINELQPQFDQPIVTTLEPLTTFYPAEDYHQDYYNQNSNQGYCQIVISPKLSKLRNQYADKLKPEALS